MYISEGCCFLFPLVHTVVSGSWSFVLGLKSILGHCWLVCAFLCVGERETLWAAVYQTQWSTRPSQFCVTVKSTHIFSYHWLGKSRTGNWKSPLFSLKPIIASMCRQLWTADLNDFGRGKRHRWLSCSTHEQASHSSASAQG